MVVGCSIVGRLRTAALWFALALLGQATALQLINAGPSLHYQHYRPLGQVVSGPSWPLLLLLVAQALIVGAGIGRRWSKIRPWIGQTFKVWQLVAIGFVFALTSATVSRDVLVYLEELPFATLVQLVNVGNVVLAVWAVPEEWLSWVKRKFDRLVVPVDPAGTSHAVTVDRFIVVAMLWVTVVAAVLNLVSYQAHPHITDEVGYLEQARFLARGDISVPAPPVSDAFELNFFEVQNGRWYPATPPGWPAVLALGVLVGAPWLVNPVLAGLSLLLTYLLLGEVYDRRLARLAVVLLCISPWYVFMAMNFMTHMLTLTCALLGAVAIARARRANGVAWAAVAGAAAGMVSLIRPLDGAIVAGLLGLWAIGFGGRRLSLPSLSALIVGTVIVAALVLPYNKLVSGNPLAFPIQVYDDRHFGHNSDAYGFGPDRGMGWELQPFGRGHTPLAAMINADLNGFSVNVEMFGWGTGSLIFAALLVIAGAKRQGDYLMLAVIVATVAAYFPYYYSGGPDFGARYWFLIVVPVAALTVSGIDFLHARLAAGSASSRIVATRVIAAVILLCCFTLVNYIPWRAIDKYYHFWGMRPDVVSLAKEYGFGRSLVLVRGDSIPDYASVAIYNPLDFRADQPIYAWDRDPGVRDKVIRAYSDRPIWIVDGPTITHAGYRVVEGPVSASTLLGPPVTVR